MREKIENLQLGEISIPVPQGYYATTRCSQTMREHSQMKREQLECQCSLGLSMSQSAPEQRRLFVVVSTKDYRFNSSLHLM